MQKISGPFAQKSKQYKSSSTKNEGKKGFKESMAVATSERAADKVTVGKEYKKKDKSPGAKRDPRW